MGIRSDETPDNATRPVALLPPRTTVSRRRTGKEVWRVVAFEQGFEQGPVALRPHMGRGHRRHTYPLTPAWNQAEIHAKRSQPSASAVERPAPPPSLPPGVDRASGSTFEATHASRFLVDPTSPNHASAMIPTRVSRRIGNDLESKPVLARTVPRCGPAAGFRPGQETPRQNRHGPRLLAHRASARNYIVCQKLWYNFVYCAPSGHPTGSGPSCPGKT